MRFSFPGCVVTANRLSRAFVYGWILVLAACGGENLTLPSEGEPAHITVFSGSGQSARVGSTLGEPLIVKVTDTRDRPVAGAEVVFAFTGGQVNPATTTTNSSGFASSTLRLGTQVGELTGTAAVPVAPGVTPVTTPFTAIALSDDADGIAVVSGNDQSGPVGTTLGAPLVVKASDEFGNPIGGVTVTWSAEGGGSVSETSTVTGSDGQTSVTRTLGPTAGQQTTVASADGLAGSPVTFTHTATAGSATGVVKISGDGQSALVGTQLDQPLVVQVLDEQQNPISNRPVTWVIGTGGGSVDPQNTNTDAQGFASTQWTLGPAVGGNTVNAVVSGLDAATFNATGTAGTPSASTSEVSAAPATISASGNSTITVTVRDAGNNQVAGASVTVVATGSGNTISPESVSSGSDGRATFTFSSTVAESKIITATAGGVTIEDQATIVVQKVSSTIEITSDEPDGSSVGQSVRVEFTVTGNGGTPTGSVTVSVSGGPETCSATLSSGSGFCDLVLTVPGTGPNNRRVITAQYAGDGRFSEDSDTENHRVNPVPPPNQPPVAAFTPPSCTTGQACQFTDASTDDHGVTGWTWSFGDTQSSNDQNPAHSYGAAGTYPVTLTVTDAGGLPSSVTHDVTVTDPPPVNNPPTAVDDGYSATAGERLSVGFDASVLNNDSDPEGDLMFAEVVPGSGPSLGTLSEFDADGTFEYTPNGDAGGMTDTFRYQVRDFTGVSNEATVTITIQ
jgi:PKD domain-containing protein/Big-like domain-containing protein